MRHNSTALLTIASLLLAAPSMTAATHADRLKLVTMAPESSDPEQTELILWEDFSRMAAGSEEQPDATMLPEDYFDTGNKFLTDEYTLTPGWWGMGIFQAGGCCFLGYPNMGGLITTPCLNLNGRIRVSFRMKPGDNISTSAMLIVALAHGDVYNPELYDMQQVMISAGESWTEYSFTFDCDITSDDCFIQFNGMTYDNGKFIDDIKIERLGHILSKPVAAQPADYCGDSFTAAWNDQGAADSYLLTAYAATVVGSASTLEADFSDGVLPWFIEETEGIEVAELPAGSGKALKAAPDASVVISTPGTVINGLKFSSFVYDDGNFAMPEGEITLYGCRDGKWIDTGVRKQLRGLAEKPDAFWLFSEDDIAPVDQFEKIKLEVHGTDYAYIDDITLSLDPEIQRDYVAEDLRVEGTSYRLEGLDPEADYFFFVKACDGENVSDASNLVKVYQLVAPLATEVTDFDPRGGFTANWEKSPKAEVYQVTAYNATVVEGDAAGCTIFRETFANAKTGSDEYSMDQPLYLGNDFSPLLLDEYTDNPGWEGIMTTVYDGMIGCAADYMGVSLLASPDFDASNNGGVFTLEFDCYVPAGDIMIVQNSAIDVQRVGVTAGLNHYSLTFDRGSMQTYILFYDTYGTPFLISNVEVKQDLRKGDKIRQFAAQSDWTADCDFFFNDLRPQDDKVLLYSVKALYVREGREYTSPASNEVIVKEDGARINTIEAAGTGIVDNNIYDLSGRCLGTDLNGLAHGLYVRNGRVIKK